MKAPGFWEKRGLLAWMLYPVSLIYGRISLARFRKSPRYKAQLPVLCIGNLVAGGAGKTPTAIALGREAKAQGLSPLYLTRGYGGSESGPLTVDPSIHTAAQVGDEALLLARVATTIVSQDRVKGAAYAETLAAELDGAFIIMDDGFQNPYLHKDYNLVVVDAQQSIGNGLVMPAGPLRAPLQPQVRRADRFIVIGKGASAPRLRQMAARLGKALTHATVKPAKCHLLGGTRVLAFCGIGKPEKFRATLQELEFDIVEMKAFADHHPFTDGEAEALLERAEAKNLTIVTTAKDHVRLGALGEAGKRLASKAHVIDIAMVFDDPAFPRQVIEQARRKFGRH